MITINAAPGELCLGQYQMKSMMTVRNAVLGLLVTLALLSLTGSGSFAKCPSEEYIISGRVIEEKTKKPISDAQVFLFFDDYDGIWSSCYPDYSKTNVSGGFEATIFFNTYSGWIIPGLDRCNARPKTVTVVVAAEGYLTKRWKFKTKQLMIKGEPVKRTILLPDVELRLPRRQ